MCLVDLFQQIVPDEPLACDVLFVHKNIMDRGLQLLQQFRTDLFEQVAFIKRLTYAKEVTISPVENRELTVTLEWKNRAAFVKVYTVASVCGSSYQLQPLAWRIEGKPCRRARELAQEALAARL